MILGEGKCRASSAACLCSCVVMQFVDLLVMGIILDYFYARDSERDRAIDVYIIIGFCKIEDECFLLRT